MTTLYLTNKLYPCYLSSSPRYIVTCGSDCDVRTFVGLEDDDVSEFPVSSSNLTALMCYTADVVAMAMNELLYSYHRHAYECIKVIIMK